MARRRSGRRADLRWTFGSTSALATAAGGTPSAVIVSSGNVSQTLMRIRGSILSWLDTTQAPGGAIFCAMGIIIMPEGQGATTVSSPIADANAPWIWFQSWELAYEEYVTDVIDAPLATVFRAEIDSKAMRILRPDQELQVVFESLNISGSLAVNTAMQARFLLAD